jgi:hypothetical protein
MQNTWSATLSQEETKHNNFQVKEMKAARAYGTNRRTNIIFTEKTTQ